MTRNDRPPVSTFEWLAMMTVGAFITAWSVVRVKPAWRFPILGAPNYPFPTSNLVWWFLLAAGLTLIVHPLARCLALLGTGEGATTRPPHLVALIAAVLIGSQSDRIIGSFYGQREYHESLLPLFSVPLWTSMSAALVAAAALRRSGLAALLIGPTVAAALPMLLGPTPVMTPIFAIPLCVLVSHVASERDDAYSAPTGTGRQVLLVVLCLFLFVALGYGRADRMNPTFSDPHFAMRYIPMLLLPLLVGYVVARAVDLVVRLTDRLEGNHP